MEHLTRSQETLRHSSSGPHEEFEDSVHGGVIPTGTSGLFVDDHSGRPLPLSNQRFFQLPSFTFRKSSPTSSVWRRGSNSFQDYYPDKVCERQQSTWICRHCSYANGDFGKKICAVCGLDRVKFQKRHSTGTATTLSARSLSDFGSSFHDPALSDFNSSFHSRNLSDFNSSFHDQPMTPTSPYKTTEFESYSRERLEGVERPRSFHALNGVAWASLESGPSLPSYPSQHEARESPFPLQPTLFDRTQSAYTDAEGNINTQQTRTMCNFSPAEQPELFRHGRVLTMSTSPSGRGSDYAGETVLSSSYVRDYTDTTHSSKQRLQFSRSLPSTTPSSVGNVALERRHSLGQYSSTPSNTLGASRSQTSSPTSTTISSSKQSSQSPHGDAASLLGAQHPMHNPTSSPPRCIPLMRATTPTEYVPRHLQDNSERTFSLPMEDIPLEEMPFEKYVKDVIFQKRNKCCTRRRCLLSVAVCTGLWGILLIVLLVLRNSSPMSSSSSSATTQTSMPSSNGMPAQEAQSLQTSTIHSSSSSANSTIMTSLRKNWSRLGKPIRSAGYGKHFVALNEDGSVMATLSSTRSVGQLVEVFSVPAQGDPDQVGGILFDEKGIFDMDLSSDGMEVVVALGDGKVEVYGYHNDSDTWEQVGQTIDSSVQGFPTEYAAVCFTADGKGLVTTVVATGSKALRFQVYTLRHGVWQHHGPAINRIGSFDYADVKLSADGSRLAATYGKRNGTSQQEEGTVEVLSYNSDLNNWEHYGNLLHFGYSQMSIAISSDGQALAVSDCNSTKVLVVDDGQWKQVGSNMGHAHHTCIDGSGYRVAIVNDNAISVWRFENTDWKAEFMDIMQEGQGLEAFLACSGDGKRIAVTKSKNSAVQPDSQTGTTIIYQYVSKSQ